MTSKSKSNQRKASKQPTRNWVDLPSDVMTNIINRIGVVDILENVDKVCTDWHKICKDPAMWKVINMNYKSDPDSKPQLQKICKVAVHRSQGQLVDLTIANICDDELLMFVANRSSKLQRLEIACCYGNICGISWTEALKKFPSLEELSLYRTVISIEGIETAGCYCPMLKTLKVNQNVINRYSSSFTVEKSAMSGDELGIAIGKNLVELRHLELIGMAMLNFGLRGILEGCRRLESLDLRKCYFVELGGEIGKRCFEQIKHVKLPEDSLEGCPYLLY